MIAVSSANKAYFVSVVSTLQIVVLVSLSLFLGARAIHNKINHNEANMTAPMQQQQQQQHIEIRSHHE